MYMKSQEDLEEFARLPTVTRIMKLKWLSAIAALGLSTGVGSILLYNWVEERDLERFVNEQRTIAKECVRVTSSREEAMLLFRYIRTVYPVNPSKSIIKIRQIEQNLQLGVGLNDAISEDHNSLKESYFKESWPITPDDARSEDRWFERLIEREDEEALLRMGQTHLRYATIAPLPIGQMTASNTPIAIKNKIMFGILGLLGLVYILVLAKIFFSRNAQNMNIAIDLAKTLNGFFIGVLTTLIGT